MKFGVDINLMRILNDSLRVWMSFVTSVFDLVCLFLLFAIVILLQLLTMVGDGVVVVDVVVGVVVVVLDVVVVVVGVVVVEVVEGVVVIRCSGIRSNRKMSFLMTSQMEISPLWYLL